MKTIYVNSRLHPLLLGLASDPVNRIFSRGEPWLLITPERLGRLAARLGLEDGRVRRLLDLVRRHVRRPELYCRRLGVEETRDIAPDEYPFALCPRCDGVHYPHPEDVGVACQDCRARAKRDERRRPGGGQLLDRDGDRVARRLLRGNEPRSFDGDALTPNYKYNAKRRLVRDWDKAVNRILMGGTYRTVSREFSCSVGLLHRKVKERYWENN